MTGTTFHATSVWAVLRAQHDVIARDQLLDLGYTRHAIEHRIARGRLHPQGRGVYAVGRPGLSREGRWMAAVLACGPTAALSHLTAAALWELWPDPEVVHVTIAPHARRRHPGIRVHRRAVEITRHRGIPVTTPAATLIDLAAVLSRESLEAAVNEADKRDLIDPPGLRDAAATAGRRRGARALRTILDRRTFSPTDSALERRFLALVRAAALPAPRTGQTVDGFRVDFFWPDLRLVVECDGLRYHRTPAQQARDRLRDQTHAAAGTATLRFTAAQVRDERHRVTAVLTATIARRRADRAGDAA